jgi:hypothetical protein
LFGSALVGAPDGPVHHTRIKLAVSALVASNNLLFLFYGIDAALFSHENLA